jgi:IMP dehydrogenase
MQRSLAFDDVLLVPRKSSIDSRDDICLQTQIGGHVFDLPILSANMATVSEPEMVIEIARLGGLGVLNRLSMTSYDVSLAVTAAVADDVTIAASIGVGENAFDIALTYYNLGCRIICIDVAHGHHSRVLRLTAKLLNEFADLTVIAGNIATKEAYQEFANSMTDDQQERCALKVGVGSGSLCSTRVVTGCGLPTLASLFDIAYYQDGIGLIADGGIRTSGDIVKALAAGADAVMLGSLLAGTEEAPGEVLKVDGKLYKAYRGSASYGAKKHHIGKTDYIEGAETIIPYKGPVAPVLKSLMDGVRSGLSYCGAPNMRALHLNAKFSEVSQAGAYESKPHLLLTRGSV